MMHLTDTAEGVVNPGWQSDTAHRATMNDAQE